MLTKLTVVVISQYIPIPNHYVVHLKLIQCYMSMKKKCWICSTNLNQSCGAGGSKLKI